MLRLFRILRFKHPAGMQACFQESLLPVLFRIGELVEGVLQGRQVAWIR